MIERASREGTEGGCKILPSSFRDSAGFVFRDGGELYRQVNPAYSEHYDQLIQSGLYDQLVLRNWMVPHEEVDRSMRNVSPDYRMLHAERLRFISYPYEWCCSQLKEAALLTLDTQFWILPAPCFRVVAG